MQIRQVEQEADVRCSQRREDMLSWFPTKQIELLKISEKLCRWNDIRRLETKRTTIQITHWTHTSNTTPWRRYATSESTIRWTTSALDKIGWHNNIEKCLTNLELLIQPLDPKLNDFNENKNSFYENNDTTTATQQMLMLQSQRTGQIWAWTGWEQFVNFLCGCDFLFFPRINVQETLSLHPTARNRNQFMAPQWLRRSWTTTVPTLTITNTSTELWSWKRRAKNCVCKTPTQLIHHNSDWTIVKLQKARSQKRSIRDSLVKWNLSSINPRMEKEASENDNSTQRCCTTFLNFFGKDPTDLRNFLFSMATWSQFASPEVQASGIEEEFPMNTRFDTVRATTRADPDRTQRCIPYGKYCKTGEHFVVHEWHCWVIGQEKISERKSTCSQTPHCASESRSQIHPITG